MFEQPTLDARLHWVQLEPPLWGYMIENNSDTMIVTLHMELQLNGQAYDARRPEGWDVIHADNEGVLWIANNGGAPTGQTWGFGIVAPWQANGDAWSVALRNTTYTLTGWPGGGNIGDVSTPGD